MEPQVNDNTIACPYCGKPINVSDVLFHQVQEQLKKDFEAQSAAKEQEYKVKEDNLKQAKEQLSKAQESLQEQVDVAVKQKLSIEKGTLEKNLRKQIDSEKADQLLALETELNVKSEQLKELNKTKAQVSQLQREKSELKEQVEAESQAKFNELLTQERERIRASESEKSKLDVQKRDQLIEQLQKRLEEATMKLESGSNKLTGEVTEIELRELLRAEFPFDVVEDVPSGIRGADVIQTVRNNLGAISGTILFERKQTQNFSEGWIGKLKEDGRTVKADVLVLVTRALPKDNPDSHLRDGVWVCTFDDLNIIVTLLRDGIIKTSNVMTSQQGKIGKIELLYQYLVSSDFVQSITLLLESYRKTERLIATEKETALKSFAARESHVLMAKKAILGFYGRIEGIASTELTQQVKMLDEPDKQIES